MGAAPILTITKNGETLKSCELEGESVLGRAEGCLIRLDDRAISRQHAIFRVIDGGVQVERKSEFAPLVINGIETTRAMVREADVIAIGPYLMRVSVPKAPPESPAVVPAVAREAAELRKDADVLPGLANLAADSGGANESADEFAGLGGSSNEGKAEGADSAGAAGAENLNLAAGAGDLAMADLSGDAGGGEGSENAETPEFADGLVAAPEETVEQAEDDAKTKLTPVGKLSVHLVFEPGAANVTDFELQQDEVSIGRGKNCDIVLNDKKSSRKNAIIRRAGLSFSIKDLESANGTFVNGARVREQELSGDDVIKIGNVEFQFKAMSADYSARERDFMPVPEDSGADDAGFSEEMNGMALADASPGAPFGVTGSASPSAGILGGAASGLAGNAYELPTAGPGIAGITGIGPADVKRMGLIDKVRNFKDLPRRQQIVIGIIVLGLGYFIAFDDDDEVKTAPKAKPKAGVVAMTGNTAKGPLTFEMLPVEQQRFVVAQHGLAFDYYKNKEYDKAIFELNKIFALINDYHDSRDIERYAKEGKRKLEAFEEEKRKQEEEAQLKAKVAALVEECSERMKNKQYDQANELFTQISLLDPDNQMVTGWKKEIEQFMEDKRAAEQTKQVQAEINKRAWEVYNEGLGLKKQGHYHSAIEVLSKVADIGSSDQRPVALAAKGIRACYAAIKAARDPVLAEAKTAEDAQDFPKAFALYKRATIIDPPHRAAYAGISRIQGILHDRAKIVYTEAILAESFSDFTMARDKFKKCLEIAPPDDIYHERAARKLARYFKREESPGP